MLKNTCERDNKKLLLKVVIASFLILSLLSKVSYAQTEILNTEINTKILTSGNITMTSPYNIVCRWSNASSLWKNCEVIIEVNNSDTKSDLIMKGDTFLAKFLKNIMDMQVYTSYDYSFYNDSILNKTCFANLTEMQKKVTLENSTLCFYNYTRKEFHTWTQVTKLDKIYKNSVIGIRLVFRSPIEVEANTYLKNHFNFTLLSDYNITLDPEISDCSVLDQAGATYNLTADIVNTTTATCMNISANNVTLDCQGHLIDGDDDAADYGIYVKRVSSTVTNETVKNCTLTDWSLGGVYLSSAHNNTLQNLTLSSHPNEAIYIASSNSNNLTNLTISNNNEGIYFFYSGYNILKGSRFQNNTYGIYLGQHFEPSNLIYNNLFNQTTNMYFTGDIYANYWNTTQQTGTRVYSNGTQIGGNYYTNSTGNDFSDTCTDSDENGFCDSSLTLATDNIDYLPLSNQYYNYNLTNCSNLDRAGKTYRLIQNITGASGLCMNLTANNVVLDCQGYAIIGTGVGEGGVRGCVYPYSCNSTIRNCVISNFYDGVWSGSWTNITNNTFTSNNDIALYVRNTIGYSGDYNSITNNTFVGNADGIFMYDGNNNTIANNSIHDGSAYGFVLQGTCTNNSMINVYVWNNNPDFYIMPSTNIYTNLFRNTNFTGSRSLWLVKYGWFSYNNETTGNIWLISSMDAGNNWGDMGYVAVVSRTLIAFSNTSIVWNESTNGRSIYVGYYNITGLRNDSYYNIFNNSQLYTTINTGPTGQLYFEINLSGSATTMLNVTKTKGVAPQLNLTFNGSSNNWTSQYPNSTINISAVANVSDGVTILKNGTSLCTGDIACYKTSQITVGYWNITAYTNGTEYNQTVVTRWINITAPVNPIIDSVTYDTTCFEVWSPFTVSWYQHGGSYALNTSYVNFTYSGTVIDQVWSSSNSSNGVTADYTFSLTGTWNVTFFVENTNGDTDTESQLVEVHTLGGCTIPGGGGHPQVIVTEQNFLIEQPEFNLFGSPGGEITTYITIKNMYSKTVTPDLTCVNGNYPIDFCKSVHFGEKEIVQGTYQYKVYEISSGTAVKIPITLTLPDEEGEYPTAFTIKVKIESQEQIATADVKVSAFWGKVGQGLSWLEGYIMWGKVKIQNTTILFACTIIIITLVIVIFMQLKKYGRRR